MNRRVHPLITLLVPLLLFLTPLVTHAAGSGVPLPSPIGLALTAGAKTIPEGGWTYAGQVVIHFQADQAQGFTPQVEFVPTSTPFTGVANYTGTPLDSSGQGSVTVGNLTDNTTYHWQLRLVDGSGNSSAWVTPTAGISSFDLGIDRTPPTRPVITSPTDPSPNRWYHNQLVQLNWQAHDSGSGIQGYSYVLERQAHVIPPGTLIKASGLRLPNLADGVWFLALRAEDLAGNWSPTATFRLMLDRHAPQLVWLTPAGQHINPYRAPAVVRFRFTKPVSALLRLYRVGTKKPAAVFYFQHLPANRVTTVWWDGKGKHGQFVHPGYYFFAIQATDHAGNRVRWNAGGMSVRAMRPTVIIGGIKLYPGDPKRIIVSLGAQTLWAVDGDHVVLKTLVTTGNPQLPTPLGIYHVMEKIHPFEFISPWPEGSPYYYAPSWVQWALLFRTGGYFLHDAPWRSVFGPGSNGPGTPGTNYGGSHGCVNMPADAAHFLYDWTPVGTEVDVVP